MISRRRLLAAGATTSAAAALAAGCGRLAGGDSGRGVTLEFFQFKPEAVTTFDRLIAEFEAAHPRIRVVQNTIPSPETTLRTRLVREDIPDVLSLNGNFTFGEVAGTGVFHDFSGDEAIAGVSPAIQEVLDTLGTAAEGESNGVPFANNACGILYSKPLFAEHDVAVPTTWSEFTAACETFRAAGVTPLYGALADAWTAMPPFNALASNLQPPAAFFPELAAGRATFREGYREVADKLTELYSYTQDGMAARNYNMGNQAFAQGESAMYAQGIWAVPVIKSFRPDAEIGVFTLPATDDPDANLLISGVDVALTMGRSPRHPEEALTFIRWLMRPEVMRSYAAEQLAVPTLTALSPEAPELANVLPFLQEDRFIGFTDHMIPRAVQLEPHCQQFVLDGDREAFLGALDDEWSRYRDRHPDQF